MELGRPMYAWCILAECKPLTRKPWSLIYAPERLIILLMDKILHYPL